MKFQQVAPKLSETCTLTSLFSGLRRQIVQIVSFGSHHSNGVYMAVYSTWCLYNYIYYTMSMFNIIVINKLIIIIIIIIITIMIITIIITIKTIRISIYIYI